MRLNAKQQRYLVMTPPKRVRWKCVASPDQWIDTHVYSDIVQENGETELLFKHCGWREEPEFMHHSRTSWASFLIGLKDLLDGGQGRPFGPRYHRISRWSIQAVSRHFKTLTTPASPCRLPETSSCDSRKTLATDGKSGIIVI